MSRFESAQAYPGRQLSTNQIRPEELAEFIREVRPTLGDRLRKLFGR